MVGQKTAYPPQSRSKGGTAFLFPNIKLHHRARKTGATAARGLASQCSLEFQNDQLRFLICNSGENGDTLLNMIRIFCKAQSYTNVRWTVRGQSADASNGHSMERPYKSPWTVPGNKLKGRNVMKYEEGKMHQEGLLSWNRKSCLCQVDLPAETVWSRHCQGRRDHCNRL